MGVIIFGKERVTVFGALDFAWKREAFHLGSRSDYVVRRKEVSFVNVGEQQFQAIHLSKTKMSIRTSISDQRKAGILGTYYMRNDWAGMESHA